MAIWSRSESQNKNVHVTSASYGDVRIKYFAQKKLRPFPVGGSRTSRFQNIYRTCIIAISAGIYQHGSHLFNRYECQYLWKWCHNFQKPFELSTKTNLLLVSINAFRKIELFRTGTWMSCRTYCGQSKHYKHTSSVRIFTRVIQHYIAWCTSTNLTISVWWSQFIPHS